MELQQLIVCLNHYFKEMFKAVGQAWTEQNSEDIRKAISGFSNMVVSDAVNLASQREFKEPGEVETVPGSETITLETDKANHG